MDFRDYQFLPRVVPTAAILFALPVFLGLGIWQLDRAEQKEQLSRHLVLQKHLPPLDLTAKNAGQSAVPPYRKIAVRGYFEHARAVYLENRRHGSRIGYHVITPLRIDGSDTHILVNRGWISDIPGSPAETAAPPRPVSIQGTAHIPRAPALVLGTPSDWGRSWPYITIADYTETEGIPLLPYLLLQDPDGEPGFVRNWPSVQANPGMHIGYAIQWFAFALIALAIYLRLSIQKR